jgi:hypothetical protein
MSQIDCSLSIEELEGVVWPEPEYNSHLVMTCHALRKVPLHGLTAENIRMLIAQKIGLEFIVPMAMDYLEENPWGSGSFYDGDLLENVLKIDFAFWREHSDMRYRLSEVMIRVQSNVKLYDEKISPSWIKLSKELDEEVLA